MMKMPKIPEAWAGLLGQNLPAGLLSQLERRLTAAETAGALIYPPKNQWFAALERVSPDAVKVVILGQDPYHGAGQAHGLAFSVQPEVRIPPSLRNIYKELAADVGAVPVSHGFLQHWADQGVLLLNRVLTVEAGKAASHKGWGWEEFTDHILRLVAEDEVPKVFILWGNQAQKAASHIKALGPDGPHLLLCAPHPSPLSAYQGFFGTKPFSQANAFLAARGQSGIDWQLPDLDARLL